MAAALASRNKFSSLLSKKHNEQIIQLLGPRCYSLATAVVHLRVSHSRNEIIWTKKDEDVLCFVKDYNRRIFFFRLYSLKYDRLIFERSLLSVLYIGLPSIVSILETQSYLVNFNFISNQEAEEMDDIVNAKLLRKRQRDKDKAKLKQEKLVVEELPKKSTKGKPPAKHKSKGISKHDISMPISVQRLHSVSWDTNTGYLVDTPSLHTLEFKDTLTEEEDHLQNTSAGIFDYFMKNADNYTGDFSQEFIPDIISQFGGPEEFLKIDPPSVSQNVMNDEATKKFIYDFINSHSEPRSSAGKYSRKQLRSPPPPPLPTRHSSLGKELPPDFQIYQNPTTLTPKNLVAEDSDPTKIDIDEAEIHNHLKKDNNPTDEQFNWVFMTDSVEHEKPSIAESNKKRPPKPPPRVEGAKPIIEDELTYFSETVEFEGVDGVTRFSPAGTSESDLEDIEDIVMKQTDMEGDSGQNDLIKLLAIALARRKQVFYSDDSDES